MNPEELKDIRCQLCGNVYCEDEMKYSDWDYFMCGYCYTGSDDDE